MARYGNARYGNASHRIAGQCIVWQSNEKKRNGCLRAAQRNAKHCIALHSKAEQRNAAQCTAKKRNDSLTENAMNLDELYLAVKSKRSGLRNELTRHKRPPIQLWRNTQVKVYQRDKGICQSPLSASVCTGKDQPLGKTAHVDHIVPLACGGSNHVSNLRVLCPMCHALRAERHHEGLRSRMLARGDELPPNWKDLLWDG